MWPAQVDWTCLRFGVELEYMDADPKAIELLPGWKMPLDEQQTDDRGATGGGELQTPPMAWADREQIRVMLDRLKAAGARATWSCGLHVHVGVEHWGQDIIAPMLDAALSSQQALEGLFRTSHHRRKYCPPVIQAHKAAYGVRPERDSLGYRGRPVSHRCGINTRSYFDIGTVEIRYPNASLEYDEVLRVVEVCLKFVAAVGAGQTLPPTAYELAAVLNVPADGYPPPTPAPRWALERQWLEDALVPVLEPQVLPLYPEGEILSIRPVPEGVLVVVELEHPHTERLVFRPTASGWQLVPDAPSLGIRIRLAGPEEAPAVQQLLHRAHAWNYANGFNFSAATITLAETEERIAQNETYVLEEAGELKGTFTLWTDGTFGMLGVDPSAQGKGYAGRLLAFAEERARALGWAKLTLDTPVNHPWLPAFYQRYGYRPERVVHWEGKQYDSVVLSKPLSPCNP